MDRLLRAGSVAECPHQALGYQTPAEIFTTIPMEVTHGGMVESLTSDALRTAGPSHFQKKDK